MENNSYGPARAISSCEIVAWDETLKQISGEELSRRFNPKAMLKAQIYPEIWARSLKGEEDTLAYLLEYYTNLKQFVAAVVLTRPIAEPSMRFVFLAPRLCTPASFIHILADVNLPSTIRSLH